MCFFKLIINTPKITITDPKYCKRLNVSPKNITAKMIVEIGPIAAIMAKFEELIRFIDSDTRKEGITVAINAIKKPNRYTCHGN